MKKRIKQVTVIIFFCVCSSVSFAGGANFNDTTAKAAPLNNPHFTPNVGIGSTAPGEQLDVNGTVRSTNLTVTSLNSGTQCLQADSSGVVFGSGTNCGLSTAYWTLSHAKGNVGISTVNNTVGIGTTSGVGAELTVMNGNVGIGTWVPADYFQIGKYSSSASGFEVDTNGNVGIGTIATSASAFTLLTGNLGIGLDTPASAIDITPSGGENFIQGQDNNMSWVISEYPAGTTYVLLQTSTGNSMGVSSANSTPFKILSTSASNTCVVTIAVDNTGDFGYFGNNSAGDSNFYTYSATGSDGNIDIGNGNNTWENIQMGSAVMGSGYLKPTATTSVVPPTNGLVVQGDVGIGTYNISTGLDIVGNIGIGTISYSNFLTFSPPNGGMIIEKNVGIGTYTPHCALDVMGSVGIGAIASSTVTVANFSAHSGTAACWGTNGCIGTCSAGVWPNCSTCTCF